MLNFPWFMNRPWTALQPESRILAKSSFCGKTFRHKS